MGSKFNNHNLIPEEFNDILKVLEFGATKYGPNQWLEQNGHKSNFVEQHHSIWHHIAESWSQGLFDTRGDAESDLDPLLHAAARCLMTYTKLKRGLL